MKTTTLNFYERIALAALVGAQGGRTAELSTFLRIYEKVRISEEERGATDLVQQGDRVEWKLPSPAFGTRSVGLEQEEAEALSGIIEDFLSTVEKITVEEVAWRRRVVGDLKRKAPES
ncbi:MAG TPA: hypothetical protein PKJ41_03765 [Bryobacteraceae bacterium]|nr:hypothetical protein [Bryobacteraceae bacterium]